MDEQSESAAIAQGRMPLPLDELVREGARRMLREALEVEVQEFVESHRSVVDDAGRRLVVRNGRLPEREILTGAGPISVQQPRVRDLRGVEHSEAVRFESKILPPFLRRTKCMDDLIPWLFLKGISQNDMQSALEALLGPGVQGLSAATVTRLCSAWSDEYREWSRRSLQGKEYVYLWADGIHFNIRLEEGRQCILVLMGATRDGDKEILAIVDGDRESEQSWTEVLQDLRARGMTISPRLAVADGALGFWAALRKVFPETREQRCWVHKTANVLNRVPKSVQPRAKEAIHEIWMAATKEEAERAFDRFEKMFGGKFEKAVAVLVKDRDVLLAFYDFPMEHWKHLRTTNPIESTFATVRLRHRRTKGSATRQACLAMVFKLAKVAEARWRKLNGATQLLRLLAGTRFVNGEAKESAVA